MCSTNFFKSKGLITTGFHLPYNPDLKEKASNLRKNLTQAERKLWFRYLRGFKHQVLRQKPIDNYIVDFYCSKLKLVIEIDGITHNDKKEYDQIREKELRGLGFEILRFDGYYVINNITETLQMIMDKIKLLEKKQPLTPFIKGE